MAWTRFAKAQGSLDPRPLFTCVRAISPLLRAGRTASCWGDLEDADFDQRKATSLQAMPAIKSNSAIGEHHIHLIQP
jgi:hypothetical protein